MQLARFVVAAVAGMAGQVGCAAPHQRTEVPRAEPIAPEELPVVRDRPKPAAAKPRTFDRYGARDLFDPVIYQRESIALEAGWRSTAPEVVDVAEIDYLGRCVRDLVLAQPEGARRVLVTAFAHYVTGCDPDTGKLVLERPLDFDSRERRARPDVVFLGALAPRGAGLVLRVSACGSQATFDRISITGEPGWTSPRLEVRRDPSGCDSAELPFTRALGEVIARSIQGEATIRFEGGDPGTELNLTDQLRQELGSVLDAIDAITEP